MSRFKIVFKQPSFYDAWFLSLPLSKPSFIVIEIYLCHFMIGDALMKGEKQILSAFHMLDLATITNKFHAQKKFKAFLYSN